MFLMSRVDEEVAESRTRAELEAESRTNRAEMTVARW